MTDRKSTKTLLKESLKKRRKYDRKAREKCWTKFNLKKIQEIKDFVFYLYMLKKFLANRENRSLMLCASVNVYISCIPFL